MTPFPYFTTAFVPMTFDQAFFFLFLLLFSGKHDARSQVIAWVGIYFGKQQIDPVQFAYGQWKEARPITQWAISIFFGLPIFQKARPFFFRVLRTRSTIRHFEVTWETGSRWFWNCIVGLFFSTWRQICPPKESHNALWQTSWPGLPRNLKVVNTND